MKTPRQRGRDEKANETCADEWRIPAAKLKYGNDVTRAFRVHQGLRQGDMRSKRAGLREGQWGQNRAHGDAASMKATTNSLEGSKLQVWKISNFKYLRSLGREQKWEKPGDQSTN